ncbi:MAG: DfrB family trimethoprim-resistant dihydrofolate reductase [Hydrogenophaga sp.]|uniref:trimethoprim-resistant dihydrofolate reductase DfrB n=1 Tax=Hydrogenophaga sp. TaxID=1904254 RepID=UPI002620938B|nr:trimethoprim-resistant dihydrofolate reductase DfrB [Hydrogenophaga sp.]MCV0440348.1 DfrB family trimethoprim-resistant dihydrofolate reductase [Hydrogenophaga sp.]
MDQSDKEISPPAADQFALPFRATFSLGDRVRKKSGASWQGHVVGWYCTKLTPEGYAVESESHPGSVQIYPVAALERVA